MAIVIVFTICKNGGNSGVLCASFSCAVFGVRGSSDGNAGASYAGALCLTGAASSALTVEKDSASSASVFAFACER